MLSPSKKTHTFPDWNMSRYRLIFPIAILLFAFSAAGCNAPSTKQLYENSETGIQLEKPGNWEVAYSERNGVITLVAEQGNWKKDSARIEIQGPACLSIPTNFDSSLEEVEWNIERIRRLYNLDSVTIVQEPIQVTAGEYEVTKATVTIPTLAMADDPNRNQIGDEDTSQTIEIYAITHGNDTLMTYLYKGNSTALNTQAEEIIDSVQITCSTEP